MFVSAFDLFRIGPGPSSSHTVGPMRAARRFVHELAAEGAFVETRRVHVDLYGSLACTGRDHGGDCAILGGLSGELHDRTDGPTLAAHAARTQAEHVLSLGGRQRILFDPATDLVFHVDKAFDFHSNALRFTARNANGDTLLSRLYFSTGEGQFIAEGEGAGARASLRVPFAFFTGAELLALGQKHNKKAAEMMRANELSLRSPDEVRTGLLAIAVAMRAAVDRGIATDGMLPGSLGLPRRASTEAAALAGTDPASPEWAAAFATAVAEENAAGGRIVSAPSNGAAGPVAAVLSQWRASAPGANDDGTVTFLLAAAAIGALLRQAGVKHAGCQGEVGVAAAMAAAGLASTRNASNAQVLFAAERALEPHLGMTCDPIGGVVQQPCIGRNAAAAAHAVRAAALALKEPDPPRVAIDSVIRSMVETGRNMTSRYKESSLAGLAVNVVDC